MSESSRRQEPALSFAVPPSPQSGTTESIYVPTPGGACFATVHRPAAAASGIGVLMCPSFGWDDLCIHRVKRTWAESFAAHGHVAMRFDLPGTGDSEGGPDDPELTRSWIDSVGAAAAWLKSNGCRRVVGFGIGFGGMLAWLSAAAGAPVDDLMLWAVPTSGRRLLREIRVAATFGVSHVADGDGDQPLVDLSGQIIGAAMLADLERINLGDAQLPDPAGRHALIFTRTGNRGDLDIERQLRAAGLDVSVTDGNEYRAMMQYVRDAAPPDRAIAASVSWLDDRAAHSLNGAGPQALAAVGERAQELVVVEHGQRVRERPVTLVIDGQHIRGILAEPLDAPAVGLCAVFFSGGSDRRLGPNRMWVDTSRRWAARGVTAVRLDLHGIGDSDGDDAFWRRNHAHYEPGDTPMAQTLLDALVAQAGVPDRFILGGFCSGANRAFRLAVADPRVLTVCTIDMPFFLRSWWTLHVRQWWVVDWTPTAQSARWRIVTVNLMQHLIRVANRVKQEAARLRRRLRPDRTDRALAVLSGRRTRLMLLLAPSAHELEDLQRSERLGLLERTPEVELRVMPGDDIRFRPPAMQDFARRAFDDAFELTLTRPELASPTALPSKRDGARSDNGAGTAPAPDPLD